MRSKYMIKLLARIAVLGSAAAAAVAVAAAAAAFCLRANWRQLSRMPMAKVSYNWRQIEHYTNSISALLAQRNAPFAICEAYAETIKQQQQQSKRQ